MNLETVSEFLISMTNNDESLFVCVSVGDLQNRPLNLELPNSAQVYVISRMLQSENIDGSSVVEMIDKTRQAMVEMRSDKGFQQALVDECDLCNNIETEAEFQVPEARPLKKKKQYGYESFGI
ncbi:hypothetical protein AVEN_47952-1 [Araneus ventricosus]|uniref:Uncharacterized protein n=1 Tax=Araneus ventricosus TaxID=182803 RepID=A0A4Y2DSH5_ARAVE|nr:hypothetical protein AVEN_47952-1 [Araneus ventricosus]